MSIQIDASWVAARKRWETPDGRYYFDAQAAADACEFFPLFLKHHRGDFGPSPEHPEGAPFKLLAYQDHLLLRPLFGWKRIGDGLRRFRKVFLAIPKGNGKSPLGAGLGIYLAEFDGEAGAEVYAAAADRDQASIVFDTAKIMVESEPELAARARPYRRTIEFPRSRSYYRVLSADVRTKHGPNIHGLIFDEFHAQPTRELYEVLHRGTVKRRQPVTFMMTTAGDDDESICAEEWRYAQRVQSGTNTDETYLPVIFEAAKDDDWKDPKVWERLNPGLGITVKRDAIVAECAAAQNEPRKLNDFLRYHCNRWVNQATAWIPVDWWDACREYLPESELEDCPLAAGLDLARKDDLAAFVLVFRHPLDGDEPEPEPEGDEETPAPVNLNFRISVVPYFWIPEDTMRAHEKEDRVPYSEWVAKKLIRVTEGNVIDYTKIYEAITGPIMERFPQLHGSECGYDPAFATELATRLNTSGLRMVEVLQNYQQLSEPSQIFEALVKGKRVRHDGHRVLRWNVENVSIKTDDAGRMRPVKPRDRSKRIDGVTSLLMGLSRIVRGRLGSVYDERGLTVL